MSWRTSLITLWLRRVLRTLRVQKVLALFQAGRNENRFSSLMLDWTRDGDIVWDVGANVGCYSCQFAKRVGRAGRVFAFEPSPINVGRLREAVRAMSNVTVLPIGLGARAGVAHFLDGADAFGTTGRVLDPGSAASTQPDAVCIHLAAGDELIASGAAQPPNVLKIDTEGFEWEVVTGLQQTLRLGTLRIVCIEVHFGILDRRGLRNVPSTLEKLLTECRFLPRWVDASHLVAVRAN